MADKKISQLTGAGTLTGTEEVPIVQGGITVKTTTQDIADLGGGGSVEWTLVTANTTAENDKYYSIANNTNPNISLPTPITGKGFIVYGTSGNFQINGNQYVQNVLIYAFYTGTIWSYNQINSGGGGFDPSTDLVGTITPANVTIATGQTVEEGFSNAQGQIDEIYNQFSFIDLPTVLSNGNTAEDLDIVLESSGSGTVLTLNPNGTTFEDTTGMKLTLTHDYVEVRDTSGTEVGALSKSDLSFANVSGGQTQILPHEGTNNTSYLHPEKPTGTETYRMLSDAQSELLRKNGIDYFNDFIGISPTDTGQSVNDTVLAFNQSGTGAFNRPLRAAETFSAVTLSNNGVLQQSMGTTTTGSASVQMGSGGGSIVIGGGVTKYDALVCMNTLSDSSQRYTYKSGLFSLWTTNPVASIGFVYDEGGVENIVNFTASANWRVVTIDAITRTITDTGIAVSNTAFQKLSFVVNSAGTSVEFFIDDVSVATHTTNIPTGLTKKLMLASGALKHVGTTERIAYLDYVLINGKLATPRL